jgi:hypothetical protein
VPTPASAVATAHAATRGARAVVGISAPCVQQATGRSSDLDAPPYGTLDLSEHDARARLVFDRTFAMETLELQLRELDAWAPNEESHAAPFFAAIVAAFMDAMPQSLQAIGCAAAAEISKKKAFEGRAGRPIDEFRAQHRALWLLRYMVGCHLSAIVTRAVGRRAPPADDSCAEESYAAASYLNSYSGCLIHNATILVRADGDWEVAVPGVPPTPSCEVLPGSGESYSTGHGGTTWLCPGKQHPAPDAVLAEAFAGAARGTTFFGDNPNVYHDAIFVALPAGATRVPRLARARLAGSPMAKDPPSVGTGTSYLEHPRPRTAHTHGRCARGAAARGGTGACSTGTQIPGGPPGCPPTLVSCGAGTGTGAALACCARASKPHAPGLEPGGPGNVHEGRRGSCHRLRAGHTGLAPQARRGALLAETDVLVTTNGAAMANSVLLRPGAALLLLWVSDFLPTIGLVGAEMRLPAEIDAFCRMACVHYVQVWSAPSRGRILKLAWDAAETSKNRPDAFIRDQYFHVNESEFRARFVDAGRLSSGTCT